MALLQLATIPAYGYGWPAGVARTGDGAGVVRSGAAARGVAVAAARGAGVGVATGATVTVGGGAGVGTGVPPNEVLGRYMTFGSRPEGVGVGAGAGAGGEFCWAAAPDATAPAANAAAARPKQPPIRYLPRFTRMSLTPPT